MCEIEEAMLHNAIGNLIENNEEIAAIIKNEVFHRVKKEKKELMNDKMFSDENAANLWFEENEDWLMIHKYSVILEEIIKELPQLIINFLKK